MTLDGDILIDLNVESSAQGPDQNVAGTNYPSFVTRKVGTRLRLRDGESNLLAGLLREDERSSCAGFPGAIHVPILKQVFSFNSSTRARSNLIMLLTPHIVRTNEITEDDLRPIYIGSQQNIGLGGPPPLIAPCPPRADGAGRAATPGRRLAPRSPATAPGAPANRRRRRQAPRWRRRPARRRCRAWSSCRSSRHRGSPQLRQATAVAAAHSRRRRLPRAAAPPRRRRRPQPTPPAPDADGGRRASAPRRC